MAFRHTPASVSLDARAQRGEDGSLTRLSAQQTASSTAPETKGLGLALSRESISPALSPVPQRRRVVLPDPVAFRYLEEDPAVKVLQRREVLQGYELYLVEQWACSRQSPTLIIVTYTGDPKHSVVVGVLGIPADEKEWSPRLRVYFKAISQYHARPKDTELGELMITNLSGFPSALTVIPIPDGDIKKHRQIFIVNEDLKRLGCSGRSGMTLSDPTPATQAKFLQLYKTSERVPFQKSVLELVKLCQVALNIFGKLDQAYIDGLLCDVTEAAINDWWTEIGSEYYNIEPTDGILGPITVAALLGTLMGARNRLSWFGAPVSKDVFDLDSMKRGIGHFQKTQKLERTRRLDRQTLLKLHSVTAKAAAGEGGWGVQKAVKSTVAEIGGKRGEIVIGMVGGRDKAGIGDIETLDIDRFIGLVHGERAKWLWYGKPRRTPSQPQEQSMPEMSNILFGRDEASNQTGSHRTQSLPLDEELEAKQRDETTASASASVAPSPYGMTSAPASAAESPGDRDAFHRTVFKSVAGRVSDARSGLGRIRDAVGGSRKGHFSRPSKDEPMSGLNSPSISALAQSAASLSSTGLPSPPMAGRAFSWKEKPQEYANAFRKEPGSDSTTVVDLAPETTGDQEPRGIPAIGAKEASADVRREVAITDGSIAGSVADEADLRGPILAAERSTDDTFPFSLRRRHSIATSPLWQQQVPRNENRWPRRMSFGEAEEAVLQWEDIVDWKDELSTENDISGPTNRGEAADGELLLALYSNISALQKVISPWVGDRISAVEGLDELYAKQAEACQAMYYQLSEAYQRVRQGSAEMLVEERAHMSEAVRDVEMLLARLEYEINALASKVQDVEDGVAQFEAQVGDVERMAEELKLQLETESWLHWAVRTLTGIGTGPNITRERPR